jgi:predicted lipid-binding transport protein (Tim44 family)
VELLDIIVLAVAGVVLWRLFRTLGRRTGYQPPPGEMTDMKRLPGYEQGEDKVVTLPGRKNEAASAIPARAGATMGADPLGQALTELAIQDKNFDTASFLEGARLAYEMIVTAFARADRETLRPLLGDDVYAGFDAAMRSREETGRHMETRIAGEIKTRLIDARVEGRQAYLTVEFDTPLISFVRDREDTLVEGHPERARDVTDIWTFTRILKNRDPNWLLVATEAPSSTKSETPSA